MSRLTLDEIETLARTQLSGDASADSHTRQLLRADKLARFIVDVLPVVRAAEAWIEYATLVEKQSAAHGTGAVGADE